MRQHPWCMVLWLTVSLFLVQPTQQLDVLAVIRNVRSTINVLTKLKNGFNLDLSSGCGDISSPDGRPVHESLIAHRRTLVNEESLSFNSIEMVQPTGEILWVHQMGKQVVQKVPDTALLGVLVIIAAELLRRGVNANRDTLPPVVRDFAETTILELDMKLETLSALDWKVDPFFQAELENLGSQPLEVIDKFIVSQVLPLVDKDFAPFLLKYMTGDTERIKTVTTNVKDLIELAVEILKIERVMLKIVLYLLPSLLTYQSSSNNISLTSFIVYNHMKHSYHRNLDLTPYLTPIYPCTHITLGGIITTNKNIYHQTS